MFWNNHGILGINARNLHYIRPYNPKKAIKLADDKIKTKQFLSARDIPVPKLFAILREPQDVDRFDLNSLPARFVVKPNKGFGGEGIIPIISKKGDTYYTAGGGEINERDLREHLLDIIDGRFSISNVADYAFFEQYIESDPKIGQFSSGGLPDIRIIVHNLIPVMAMLRLPTKESGGKANLHMGACGVGIDIAKGECTNIVYKGKIVPELPEGKGPIRGLKIPNWDQMLLIASKAQLLTNLGYMAIDLCLDKNVGPVLLEINARAGLSVQIANLAPLRKRLERIKGLKVPSPEKGVRIAKDVFGNTAQKKIVSISGKQIIGTEERVELIHKTGTNKMKAKIDTTAPVTVIDLQSAIDSDLVTPETYDKTKKILKLKFSLKGLRITTIASVKKMKDDAPHKLIIGKRDLNNFLIDASLDKEKAQQPLLPNIIHQEESKIRNTQTYFKTNQQLVAIDKKTRILHYLNPINLNSEREKFLKNENYNPQFEYSPPKFNVLSLEDELQAIKTDDSPLGQLFEAKKREIHLKIQLIDAIGQSNFSTISAELYGKPSHEDLQDCLNRIKSLYPVVEKNDGLSTEEATVEFEKVFKKYGLDDWKVKIKPEMLTRCLAGKNHTLFVKKDSVFYTKTLKGLIAHEIETHIITAENGKEQFYTLFNRGFANYLITQEGLAVYNAEQRSGEKFLRTTRSTCPIIAISKALEGGLAESYQYLREIGFEDKKARSAIFRAKRGLTDTSQPGAFTKDYIYLKGYHQVCQYFENGGNLKDLYYGKYNLADLAKIKKIPGLREPKILPSWG